MYVPLTFKPLFDSTISTPAAKQKAVREHILISLTVNDICGKFKKILPCSLTRKQKETEYTPDLRVYTGKQSV